MVAIIQGLQDAGLAVTLIGRRIGNGVKTSAIHGNLPYAKSSVETQSSYHPSANTNNTSQLCDDRYISSYQVAHCNAKPISSEPNSPEFPRQRDEASTTEGNFAIGIRENFSNHAPIKISFHQRNIYRSPQRELSTQLSRETEAFVNSLRKYPSVSPERHLSSEFLQRLITYTQGKKFSKSSTRSRITRKLRSKILAETSKDGVRSVKPSKSVQTYTRLLSKTRDKENTDTRRSRRAKDVHISTTYNYLGTPRRFGARATDVRYLSDVTRCLRDTLRQFCDDQTQVCPSVQSRYSRHRREHHHDYMEPRSSTDSNNMEGQVSIPVVSRGVSCLSSCEAMPGTYNPICPSKPKLCCYCQEPVPCNCRSSKEEIFQRKLENIITSWLQDLPVSCNDKPQSKAIRENKILDLIDKLKTLDYDDNFEENAKNEILECVDNLPIWRPADERDREIFKMQIVDNLMDKIRILESDKEKGREEIAQWLDNISIKSRDSQGNLVDKNDTKGKLTEKLVALVLNLPSGETVKQELLKILNEFPIKVKEDESNYKDNLALILTEKLQTLSLKDARRDSYISGEYEKHILDWLEDLPGVSKSNITNIQKNRKRAKSLTKKLQQLLSRGIHTKDIHDKMQEEIFGWLESNTENVDSQTKSKLSEKLINSLANNVQSRGAKGTPEHCKDILTEQILEWLEEIPELSGSKLENQNMAEILANKLRTNISNGNKQIDIENEISNWLLDTLQNKGEKLDAIDQNNLMKMLARKLDSVSEIEHMNKDLTHNILDVLAEIPGLNVTTKEIKNLANQLADVFNELRPNDKENIKENMDSRIVPWLSNLSRLTDVKLTPKDKENLKNKLLSVIETTSKQRKRWSIQENFSDSISNSISDMLEDTYIKDNNNNKRKILNKISDLTNEVANKKQSSDKYDVLTEKVDISEEQVSSPAKQSKHIANDRINKSNNTNYPSILQETELKHSIQENVNNILNGTKTKIENKDEVESTISNILADQAMRGENIEQTQARLLSVLKISNMPEMESNRIVNQLLEIWKELSIDSEIKPHKTPISQSFSSIERDTFIDSAQNEIFDFTRSLTNDNSLLATKKWKMAAAELAEQVSNILFDSSMTSADKDKLLNHKVLRYFQGIDLKHSQRPYNHSKELVSRLQNLAFATSTPRNSNAAENTYFPPHKQSEDLSISLIAENSTFSKYKKQHPVSIEDKQYMSQLEHKINSWLHIMPNMFGIEDNKSIRELMIKDLVADIVDRQKYLQLNPELKTAEEEELEHLKYQIFRWLNKLPNIKDLMPYIDKTQELMKLIKEVPVPQFIRDKKPYKYTVHHSKSKNDSSFDSICDEVSNWIEKTPSYLLTSSDKKYHTEMIKELANNIDQYQINNTLTETTLDNLILKWLEKMLNSSKQALENNSKGLKAALINNGIVSLSDSDSSKVSNYMHRSNSADNFQVILDDWIKTLPLKSRTSTDIKKIEVLKKDLADKLKKIQQQYPKGSENYDSKIKEGIEKYLQLLPINPMKRQDQSFLRQKVMELFEKLKYLHFESRFHKTSISNETVKTIINNWASKLPLKPGKYKNNIKKDIDQFTYDIYEKIKSNNVKDSYADIEKQIKEFLKKIPLQMHSNINNHVNDLMNSILGFIQSLTPLNFENSTKNSQSDIENLFDNLPMFCGNNPEEIEDLKKIKQNIVNKFSNKIGALNMKPDIIYDKTLYENLLKEEIDDILSNLPQIPQVLNNVDLLKDNLIEKAKHVNQKTQNELAGHTYKQQLRDAISSLPSVENLAAGEKVPFEILKDNVADAYINLHYTPNSELKDKYKQKIRDEINKFCSDYLKRFPASPMDAKQLNQELYCALQKVPRPKDDTIKSQVEQVQIKDQIHEWLKDIPLKNKSPEQQLQKNKIVSVLANILHEIEKEKNNKTDADIETRMRQDIVKWIKRLSLTSDEKKHIDEKADELINKLKSTESSRRISISNLNDKIDAASEHKSSQYQNQIPQSTLSKEDRAHLERIRQRAQRPQYTPPACLCKDASVSPIPVDESSQTEIRVGQRQPLSPNININEYNWESMDSASKTWESRKESELHSHIPLPSALNVSKQQMESSSENVTPQEQSLAWSQSFAGRNSNIIPPNQFGSSPYLMTPTPCISKPPCASQFQNQYLIPAPTYTEPQPPCIPLSCISTQPACASLAKSNTSSPSLSLRPSVHYENPHPPCQRPFSVLSQKPCPVFQPPYIPPSASAPPPCTLQQAPITPLPSTLQMGLNHSHAPPYLFQNSPQGESRKPQFCMKPSDFSRGSCPAEEFSQLRRLRCQPLVTKGAMDDVPPCVTNKFVNQSPECDSKQTENEDWGLSCAKRGPIRVPLQSQEFTRVRNYDKEKCRSRERCQGKCSGRRPRNFNRRPCLTTDSMQYCSKCCGVHCPHPSYLYFK
ncbi:hypothetical protein evm_011448 [Chilo suppressalis]|nr:hypothetical protein evm_011448 [Chilo suppressalis]